MELLEAVVLGVVQGVLEWIPVSSEAAISLAMTQLLGAPTGESINAAVFLHIGTMFSALVYFREDYYDILRRSASSLLEARFPAGQPERFVIITTAVTGAAGAVAYLLLMELVPERPALFAMLTGVALVATGLIQMRSGGGSRTQGEADSLDALLTGLLQSAAVVPGVSRSGSTVFGLLARDFGSRDAFRLSFLVSVPAVLAAQVGIGALSGFSAGDTLFLAAGISFVVGLASIEAVLKAAEKLPVHLLCFALAALAFLSALL